MGVETATYISDLVVTNPLGTDAKSQGDDHLRLLKSTIKATFPNVTGAVTPTHTELNYVDGVTSAIQTQIDTKGAHAGQTWTGTHNFTGATINVPTASPGDADTSAASTAFVDASFGKIAGQTWTGTHGFTGATITVPTQLASDNSTLAASTAFVQQVAFSAALPNQTGNSGKFLTTDGSSASWGFPIASQAEAEAGTSSTTLMTPQRTQQAVQAQVRSAPDVILQDQKTSGTAGQSVGGTYTKLNINTVVRNLSSLASISSDQVTLPAGNYYAQWTSEFVGGTSGGPSMLSVVHRLYNATGSVELGRGVNAPVRVGVSAGDQSGSTAVGEAYFTLSSTSALELQAMVPGAGGCTNGSPASVASTPEVYNALRIWRQP